MGSTNCSRRPHGLALAKPRLDGVGGQIQDGKYEVARRSRRQHVVVEGLLNGSLSIGNENGSNFNMLFMLLPAGSEVGSKDGSR
mmetsp:Transcript_84173/g.212243  ORF Transcript_84173/g.212243 Transcript_84173/m.212243 type:complete len:84 (-) Transcript_84173:95-346(-)